MARDSTTAAARPDSAYTSALSDDKSGHSFSTAEQVKIGVRDSDPKTNTSQWRFSCIDGRQRWSYDEASTREQSKAERHFLGLDTGARTLNTPKNAQDAAKNGLEFLSQLQLPSGNWACEYGGPMFLLPGMVITWTVTGYQIPPEIKTEMTRYLFNLQTAEGGWGLHVEGESTALGTALNYTALRLLGADRDDSRVVAARNVLHKLGGATHSPHWAKFWLAVLGAAEWDIVNPAPPELWLLPDWVPMAPWRWWIHLRQVFLPMSYISSKRWHGEITDIVRELREELYTEPYAKIDWAAHRNSICPRDNYHPKTWILNFMNWAIINVWNYVKPDWLVSKAEEHAWKLIEAEDFNTEFANLGPVNGPMNTVACFIRAGKAHSPAVLEHFDHLHDFLWMSQKGMLCNGTNGVQTWDTSFAIQAAVKANLQDEFKEMIASGLDFLRKQQFRNNCPTPYYRVDRLGAWGFSNRIQGYPVSDTTSEAMMAVIIGSKAIGEEIDVSKLRPAVDLLLKMKNPSDGCASYELRRGSTKLEVFNAAEVFGNIMVEYDYPECTTAVRAGLYRFLEVDPTYRRDEIDAFLASTLGYMLRSQRPDGSWYGSWGICFTYATMFGLESLSLAGMRCGNSEEAQRACDFLISKQNTADGGWGESYRACETGEWHDHPDGTQVVQTAWALIALMEAEYPDREPIKKGIELLMSRQQANGEWLSEGIEGVFNKSCMITYPNYKFIFPIRALGMYASLYES